MIDTYDPEVGQSPAELRQAVELYREVKPRRVLEIGVLYGGTLKVWLAGDAERVVAVDPEPRVDFESDRLTVLVGRSQDPLVVGLLREYAPFDWVFIDGDHSEPAVHADAALALELTRAGGHILFHDIVPPNGWPSTPPGRVWSELTRTHESWAYIEERPDGYPPESANGIGVIRV